MNTYFFLSRQRCRGKECSHQLVVILGILVLTMVNILCQMQTVAFVEVRPTMSSSSRTFGSLHNRKNSDCGSIICNEKRTKSPVGVASGFRHNNESLSVDEKSRGKMKNSNRQKRYSSGPHLVTSELDTVRSSVEIEDWITKQLREHQEKDLRNNTSFSSFAKWSIHEYVDFIKYLQKRHAYTSVFPFLCILDCDYTSEGEGFSRERKNRHRMVKVYTTALFAISSSIDLDQDKNDGFDPKTVALEILDQMQRNHVPATTLTYVAVFKNLQGRPVDVMQMIRFLERRESCLPKADRITWNAELYHAAIYACGSQACRSRHTDRGDAIVSSRDLSNDWQTPLILMQHMQRKGIQPTSKTYLAVLNILAQNQAKISIVKSIVQQWKNSKVAGSCDGNEEARIWAMALNACAVVGDFYQALQFVEVMSETCKPNLRHCTALLKSLARTNGDSKASLASTALDAMMGNKTAVLKVEDDNKQYRVLLPRTDLDIIALNTILSIVVNAGNFNDAQLLFNRIQDGDFIDSSGSVLSPDRITYHNLLAGCRDPEIAKNVIKEMRLSRRNRHGAIPPNSVTYAHAISACQHANIPDLKMVNLLMKWADEDKVKSTVFMYGSAIWTAQRCGNLARCLELYGDLEKSGCRPNGVVLNGLLSALCDNGAHLRALEVFELLKDRGYQVSSMSLKRLVFATMQSNKSSQFTEAEKEKILLKILRYLDENERQVSISSPVFEALILHYAERGKVDEALSVVDQINGCLDQACFRAILLAYSSCSRSRWYEAVELLHTTIVEGCPLPGSVDQIALSHVLIVCSRANEFEEGLALLNLYGIPVKDLPKGFAQISVVALNALIAACGRGDRPDLSVFLLNEMSSRYGLSPDSRSYRSAIIACNKAQHAQKVNDFGNVLSEGKDIGESIGEPSIEWWECCLGLYRRMTEEGLKPDVQTHSSVIASCEAAGEWQRALWILQTIIDNSKDSPSSLNVYCWNAALSACEKGGAWVEALDLYERMLESVFKPNVVTINSIMEALDKADQKELAQSIYNEGLDLGLLDPWKITKDKEGVSIVALDLHTFSESMAKAAIRNTMDTWLDEKDITGGLSGDFVIITGKGKHSSARPVLREAAKRVLREYGITAELDASNPGRIVVCMRDLLDCFNKKSWS